MNNFGTKNLGLEKEVIAQEIFLKFAAGALSFVFIGAFLMGVVGAVIWVTSGGNEDRNDSSSMMIKSSLVGMIGSFIGYVALRIYANVIGVDF